MYDDVSNAIEREKGCGGESVIVIGKSQNRQERMGLRTFMAVDIKLEQGESNRSSEAEYMYKNAYTRYDNWEIL